MANDRRGQPVNLGDLFRSPGSSLGGLARAAAGRMELLDLLRARLPAELQACLVGCNVRDDGTLVLTASSPAWAARLRFEAPGLLACCRERFPATARVRVRSATP
ncbi:MAG: DUF721 domain-containing protein [Chromatiales bacterium]|jgi:hypothetical protein|nr:DUF721 domain-containing protein [Chromatiales bacterium]